ncbi:MAG: FGGY-family carbohydrate kinase [Clostridiaceae bacterium]|nr:FGGY-family carbohydrate kinase [Clostridiaceae bacterium]
MSLLGLDIGTSGCKATIIEDTGSLPAQAYQDYPLISPQSGWQEIDPEQVWRAAVKVIVQVRQNSRSDAIRAISVSSFGEAVVALDRSGQTLGRSMIYIDCRGQEEAAYLRSRLDHEQVLGITGTAVQPMYSLCKIMWLKKNRPEEYRKTWKYLLFADYILYRLGAGPYTDYSLAARTLAFDVFKKKWSPELIDCAGIDAEKFGTPVQSGTVVGQISGRLASELCLPSDVLLVAGGHDQACAALGAGVIHSNLAVDGMGTTECITPAFNRPAMSEQMAQNHYACVPHVIPNLYVTYAFTFTSGSVLKWYRDYWGDSYQAEATRLGINIYDLMIDRAAKDPGSLFLLPHFAGAATPYMDQAAQGAIVGLTINTRPADIIKAILEGLTYEMMINVERLALAGIQIDELLTVGGLARSDAFLQLKATMMGKPVTTLAISEAGTLGVAILAGTAGGVYKSIEEAVGKLVRRKKTFYPDSRLHEQYQEKFAIYKKMYPAVKSITGG